MCVCVLCFVCLLRRVASQGWLPGPDRPLKSSIGEAIYFKQLLLKYYKLTLSSSPAIVWKPFLKTFNINLLCYNSTLATLFSLCGGVRKYHSQLLLLFLARFFFLRRSHNVRQSRIGRMVKTTVAEQALSRSPAIPLSDALVLPPTRTIALVCEREGDSAFSTKKKAQIILCTLQTLL